MNAEAPGTATAAASPNANITLEFQLFPHSETPLHRQDQSTRPFIFTPVEKIISQGTVVHIGRKIDRSKDGLRGTSREDRAQNNVSVDVTHMSTADKEGYNTPTDCIAFRSKVVSRHHAELFIGEDKQLYFKDVGSSSGSFLNRLRLSPSGKESKPYRLKSGDVIQLGVDYQGRQEEIYKAVMMKVFINSKKTVVPLANKQRLNRALRMLLHAMKPNSQKEDENQTIECCICINSMAPLQALFLAPCSHCFHYKCVTTLLGTGYMFQCPLCRQVANLEASVAEPETVSEMGIEEVELIDNAVVQDTDSVRGDERVDVTEDEARMDLDDDSAGEAEGAPTSPVDIPIRSTNRDTVISPSTPLNTMNLPAGLDRSGTNQPRRPDVPVQIFNTLTKLADALSKNDGSQVQNTIDEYAVQMKTLLHGLGGNEENAQALLAKMVETMQNSSL